MLSARLSLALLAVVSVSCGGALAQRSESTTTPVTQNRNYPSYDWMPRHEAIVAYHKSHPVDLVFIGDSIVHRFGGEPVDPSDRLRRFGAPVWDKYYGSRKASNLGFGSDRTENVLWRLQNGELDGIAPKAIVIEIGTNNLKLSTPAHVFEGIMAVADLAHAKQPGAQILLLGVFPRGEFPSDPLRDKAKQVNALLADVRRPMVTYLDLSEKFLSPNGTISPSVMNDGLHPTQAGYQIWAEAIEPTLKSWLGN